jgi:hypothetical protein
MVYTSLFTLPQTPFNTNYQSRETNKRSVHHLSVTEAVTIVDKHPRVGLTLALDCRCEAVIESWKPPSAFFSSSYDQIHENSMLDNTLHYPCWAAANNDLEQVSPRSRCSSQRRAEWLSWDSVVLLVRWAG